MLHNTCTVYTPSNINIKLYSSGPTNYTSTHVSVGMLLIGSSRKPIVLHEITNRIPLVIGNLALKSFNIEVSEHKTLINGDHR